MVNKRNWLGMLVMVLVFGVTVVGCDNGNNGNNGTISSGGSQVNTKYRGTYKFFAYSGTTSITTTEYSYIVAATKAEYSVSSNGVISTNTIYDDAWTEGQELWVRGSNTRSLIGKFDVNGNTLTVGTSVYTKGNAGSYSLNGTWTYYSVYKYSFSGSDTSGTFEYYQSDNPYQKGTYTTADNSMTMTITHMGKSRVSSYVGSSSSQEWYTKEEVKTAFLAPYRTQLQKIYYDYVSAYGTSNANQIFQSNYGTTNIDLIVQSQYGNSIDTSLNSLYKTDTVTYVLGYTLFLGGITYTKE